MNFLCMSESFVFSMLDSFVYRYKKAPKVKGECMYFRSVDKNDSVKTNEKRVYLR